MHVSKYLFIPCFMIVASCKIYAVTFIKFTFVNFFLSKQNDTNSIMSPPSSMRNGFNMDRIDPTEVLVDQATSSLQTAISLENIFGVNFLTQEARMLALIKNNPGQSLKFYLTSSGLSPRWFSITIQKLIKAGLIEKSSSETDERSRTLR